MSLKKAHFIKFMDFLGIEATDESKETPILLLHGNQDEIIHVSASQKAYNFLQQRGHMVYLECYDAVHKIPQHIAPLIKDFISASKKLSSYWPNINGLITFHVKIHVKSDSLFGS